jgi:hypothetical protein
LELSKIISGGLRSSSMSFTKVFHSTVFGAFSRISSS